MYTMRHWAVRHARGLKKIYELLEWTLVQLSPIMTKIGFDRLEGPVYFVEKRVKSLMLDSQSCGQCIVGSTGMSCPMNCPKSLRNGPCGGVRQDGGCEVDAEMTCVWVLAWQGNKQMAEDVYPIQAVQAPIDNRLWNKSAWLHELTLKTKNIKAEPLRMVDP